MSDNLPKTGMVLVEVSMYMEKTQPYSSMPCSWAMMVGMAVPTTVPSMEARNRPIMIPKVTRMVRWRDIVFCM